MCDDRLSLLGKLSIISLWCCNTGGLFLFVDGWLLLLGYKHPADAVTAHCKGWDETSHRGKAAIRQDVSKGSVICRPLAMTQYAPIVAVR